MHVNPVISDREPQPKRLKLVDNAVAELEMMVQKGQVEKLNVTPLQVPSKFNLSMSCKTSVFLHFHLSHINGGFACIVAYYAHLVIDTIVKLVNFVIYFGGALFFLLSFPFF
jgi:hypothetical protein